MVIYIQEEKRGGMGLLHRCGTTVQQVTLPTAGPFCACRRRRLWRRLQKSGVRLAAMPRQLEREASRWGIRRADVAAMRLALLPQLYERCHVVEADAAALRAKRAEPEVYDAAAFLAEKSRYLCLELEQDAQKLADALRREYGISVGAPGRRVCGGITFTGQPRCGEVRLGRDCEGDQQVCYAVDTEEVEEGLLAALWQTGEVKTEDIRVLSARGIDTGEERHYNAMT